MGAEKRHISQEKKSIYAEKGDVTVNYGEKKIRKILGNPPFFPEVFLGRDDDLVEVHDKLFKGENLLLLINGAGGALARRLSHPDTTTPIWMNTSI